jgi:hypothetical protein
MGAICEELEASGEFVGAERLTGRNAAKIVTYDGVGAPVVTDRRFPKRRSSSRAIRSSTSSRRSGRSRSRTSS